MVNLKKRIESYRYSSRKGEPAKPQNLKERIESGVFVPAWPRRGANLKERIESIDRRIRIELDLDDSNLKERIESLQGSILCTSRGRRISKRELKEVH